MRTREELLDELVAMTKARDLLANTADRIISERDTARKAADESIKDAKALRAALFPFLRLDHDIGDEWAEVCQRARSAYEGRGA